MIVRFFSHQLCRNYPEPAKTLPQSQDSESGLDDPIWIDNNAARQFFAFDRLSYNKPMRIISLFAGDEIITTVRTSNKAICGAIHTHIQCTLLLTSYLPLLQGGAPDRLGQSFCKPISRAPHHCSRGRIQQYTHTVGTAEHYTTCTWHAAFLPRRRLSRVDIGV